MRYVEKIELPQLSKAEKLNEQQMNAIKGSGGVLEMLFAAWAATPAGSYSFWERCNEGDSSCWHADIYDFTMSNGYAELGDTIGWASIFEQFDEWLGITNLY